MNRLVSTLAFVLCLHLVNGAFAQSIIADWDTYDKKSTQQPAIAPAQDLKQPGVVKLTESPNTNNISSSDVKLSDVMSDGDKALSKPAPKKEEDLATRLTTRKPYDFRNKTWPQLYLNPSDEGNKHLPKVMYQKDYSVLLFDAISQNNISAIDMLISRGADINASLERLSMTPLIFAVINNQNVAAEYLVLRGADINRTDAAGRTALHYAAHNQNIKMVELLMKYGADPYLRDADGKSAYEYLPEKIRDQIILSKLTSQRELDDALLQMALHGNLRAVDYLVGRGANVSANDKNNNSVLINAVKSKNSKLIAYLLENGANPLQCNMQSKDAYILAYESGMYNDARLIDTFIIKIELETGIKHKRYYTMPEASDDVQEVRPVKKMPKYIERERESQPAPPETPNVDTPHSDTHQEESSGFFNFWNTKDAPAARENIREEKLEKIETISEPVSTDSAPAAQPKVDHPTTPSSHPRMIIPSRGR